MPRERACYVNKGQVLLATFTRATLYIRLEGHLKRPRRNANRGLNVPMDERRSPYKLIAILFAPRRENNGLFLYPNILWGAMGDHEAFTLARTSFSGRQALILGCGDGLDMKYNNNGLTIPCKIPPGGTVHAPFAQRGF
jgi:hypothetical protein